MLRLDSAHGRCSVNVRHFNEMTNDHYNPADMEVVLNLRTNTSCAELTSPHFRGFPYKTEVHASGN